MKCSNCGLKIRNTYLVKRNGQKMIACFNCAEIKNWEKK